MPNKACADLLPCEWSVILGQRTPYKARGACGEMTILTDTHNPETSRLKVQFCSIKTKIIIMCQPLILFINEKNALNPGFCKGEATFSHLS